LGVFHLISYLIVGLIAGAVAKALMPGDRNEPKGCLTTMLLGCAGAFVVGFVMHNVLHEPPGGFFRSLIGATIGACLILWVFGKASSKRG